MAVFNQGPFTINPGAERHGGSVNPPDTLTSATIQLTDPNGVWDTTVGNITKWGLQKSTDGGANWTWGPVFQDAVAFGSRDRSGGMPSLRVQSFDSNGNPAPIAPGNTLLRLAAVVDTSIVLGVIITTG